MDNSQSSFYKFVKQCLAEINVDAYRAIESVECKSELDQLELASLGMESIDMFELIGRVEDSYRVKVNDYDVLGISSLGELKKVVEKLVVRGVGS